MPSNVPKTNAVRLLESRKVAFQAYTYPETIHSAEEAAAALGAPAAQVFKTLVVMRERGRPLLVMVPGGRQLDLRRLAAAVGEKKLRMATQKEAEAKTGLLVGGIGALALLNRGFDMFLDAGAQQYDEIYVNGGQRGLNLRLRVADLVAVTNACIVDATELTTDEHR